MPVDHLADRRQLCPDQQRIAAHGNAPDLGVTEGAAGQVDVLTALFPGIAAPMVAVVIPANLNLCVLVTDGGRAQARFWRGGFGRLELLCSSKRNKSCS
ncbi:hypothetical protein O3S81_20320 [Agrobacterium sp. SOY23]|uniref:hypothetical protein n=1 Tax=Agrobacterium sp. SOY23 TaxID=3014555 RepID=UPI0022AE8BE3|nr:hypothetical protein [Agrobacterium sp. SOY23]MCZ4432059.1 hypothetical protein [Agrobacterium sp. SOY23]